MTKFATALALVLSLSAGTIASTASAAPSYGLTIGTGHVNPFAAVDGR